MDTVITTENLGKKYIIRHKQQERYVSLRDVITRNVLSAFHRVGSLFCRNEIIHPQKKEDFWALKNISFEVQQGERVGIIGMNGAGKTTLLKLLSRITEPSSGRIEIKGRVASLLEVGTGFHPELTGRENIFLNGAVLGMSRSEIRKKFDDIVSFAEVEKFLDTPVKRYSSGMYVRLAFAVAAHLEPEILLIDEVLAVGDVQFQKKCLGKMEDGSIKEGRTVLFVSHNMAAIRQLCSRCMLLEKGNLVASGETSLIISQYLSSALYDETKKAKRTFKSDEEKEFQVLSIRLLNKRGEVTQNFECDEPVHVEIVCISRNSVPALYGYMEITNREGICVLESVTHDISSNCLDALPKSKYKLIVTIPPRSLSHGEYTIYLNFESPQGRKDPNKFSVDKPGYVCSFRLDDNTTQRGNRRRGYLSTLLKWDISSIS
jgi:lipopolysaccharide transport system ATP-binding protein